MIDLLYNDAHQDFIRRRTEQETEKLQQAMHERRQINRNIRNHERIQTAQKKRAPARIVHMGVTYVRADLIGDE